MVCAIAAALITVYLVLAFFGESYIHPVTILTTLLSAGVERCWRAAAHPYRTHHHCDDRNHSG